MPDHKTPDNSPNPLSHPLTIRLIENREQMVTKLAEYKARYKPHGAPETQYHLIYKMALASQLVEFGEVDTIKLAEQLRAKYGFLDEVKYNDACVVISDYIQTGGKNVGFGTGLPKTPEGDVD